MKRIIWLTLSLLAMIAIVIPISGCVGLAMYYVPPGYIGRIMTPSGWDNNILEPGQVNLGAKGANGQFSTLVLLEATTITVQEQFRDAPDSPDKNDHRILTLDGVPTAVDMYVRLMLPDDETARNNIFVQVTPEVYLNPVDGSKDDRVKVITLNNVYARFTELDVRNRVRDIIAHYKNFSDVLVGYTDANKAIAAAAIQAFKDNHVPLKLQDAQLSQVKPDPQVWDAEVKKKAADAQVYTINSIGKAMADNPGYQEFLKWQSLQNIASTAAQNGNNTVIITDASNGALPGIVVNPITSEAPHTATPTTGGETK